MIFLVIETNLVVEYALKNKPIQISLSIFRSETFICHLIPITSIGKLLKSIISLSKFLYRLKLSTLRLSTLFLLKPIVY